MDPNAKNSVFRTLFLILGASIIGFEGLYLSQSFDAALLISSGKVDGWQQIFGHMGTIARWGLSFAAAIALLLNKRLLSYFRHVALNYSIKKAITWGAVQVLCFLILLFFSNGLFAEQSINTKPSYWYWLWLVSMLLCGVFWALMWANPSSLLKFFIAEKYTIVLSAIAATVIALLASATSALWGPLADYTFELVTLLINLVSNGEVTSLKEERTLGLNSFLVNIAPVCSGYEGIGLISAFVALFLYTHKSELRFPQCLVLFPLGILCIWLLNVVRIVALILIGAYWSADIAIGGFHSFGGWITFILVSLGLLWLASKNQWISSAKISDTKTTGLNLPTATLIPVITLLTATIITSALSANFDWLYPLRVLLVILALAYVWSHLNFSRLKLKLEPIAVGLAMAGIWFLAVEPKPEQNQAFTETLLTADVWVAWCWIGIRFVGSVVTVPIAEELAFRGYLLCTLAKKPVTISGRIPFSAAALIISSLVFGALHGDWFAGVLAGLVYGVVRYRSESIQAPILAHSTTNLALFICALATDNWALI